MPFLKSSEKISPSRKVENSTAKNGLRHAIFKLSGSKYVGEWKENRQSCKGAIVTKSRYLYEGDWLRSLPEGFGVLAYPSEDVHGTFHMCFRGDFEEGEKCGEGDYHYRNGAFYTGHWKDGQRHGYGMMWYVDGAFYAGDYFKGKRHGLGMLVRKDGNRYEGEWKNGLKHGRGRFFHLHVGQMQEGVWFEDVCVFSILLNIPFRQRAVSATVYPLRQNGLENIKTVHDTREAEALAEEMNSCVYVHSTQEEGGE